MCTSSLPSLGFIYNTAKTNIRRSPPLPRSIALRSRIGRRARDGLLSLLSRDNALFECIRSRHVGNRTPPSSGSFGFLISCHPLIAPFKWQRRIRWPWDLIALPSRNARAAFFPMEIPWWHNCFSRSVPKNRRWRFPANSISTTLLGAQINFLLFFKSLKSICKTTQRRL